ncbi:hypothetical protein J3E71DRAFT_177461 [Bipolaris maydis]|nr:hypothetical protein J3E71DRAFT_177461 [Bipolaris maydis]
MRYLYFIVLVRLSNALFGRQEIGITTNVTGETCKKTTAISVMNMTSTMAVASSKATLFPTSPSLRLPRPLWDNRTNMTRNLTVPNDPTVSFSATSNWKDNLMGVFMYKLLLVMIVSFFPILLAL